MTEEWVLIAEDDQALAELLRRQLGREALAAEVCHQPRQLFELLERRGPPTLLLLDYRFGDSDAEQIVQELRSKDQLPPFFVATGMGSEQIAVNMMRQGARDYLVKDASFLGNIGAAVRRCLADLRREKELEQMRRDLAVRNATLSGIAEVSLDGILAVDAEGRLLFVNRRMEELWKLGPFAAGCKAQEIFEQLADQLTEPRRFRAWVANVAAPLVAVSARHDDLSSSDGRIFELYSTPMLRDDGIVFGRVWFFRDVSAVRHAARSLARTLEAKVEFLNHFSHEVRTPVNGITGFLELLAGTQMDPFQKELIGNLRSGCEHLVRLINATLDLGRLEAGALILDPQPFMLRQELEACLRLIHPRPDVSLRLEMQEDDALVQGDSLRLGQILVNLLGNAAKFTHQGEIVLLASRAETGRWAFSVRDTGPGIDLERQQAIFEAWTQEKSSTARTHGGSGLGLSICLRLVDLMGGRLQLRSETGKGSDFSFTVSLPDAEL
ncbi:MAG: Signal transduction histidine-protein kinase BarA [Verrucomicrobiota bacterium]|jgi:signal transduction histidine kinase/CheY-like chemotaxis protein